MFIQNEEVLKKCAQEYLARVKQEEQRYQTLKIHAEEKLDKYVHTAGKSCFPVKSKCFNKCFNISWPHSFPVSNRANEEIAQVRTKASAENMALTASLRKEQMRNESMEQALQQKVADDVSTPNRRVLSSDAAFAAVTTVASLLCLNRIKRSRNSPRSAMS